MLTALFIR